MNKTALGNRIKELELELSNLKSGVVKTESTTRHPPEDCDIIERKQAEIILQKTDEHYKIMFESSPVAINITRGTDIIYANPSYLKMFRYLTIEDLKKVAPLDMFTPEWRPKIMENIQRRAKDLPVPDSYDAECFRSDGSKFPILMYLTKTMFSDGMATVAFIIDMTQRKKLEGILHESEKKFRDIFEANMDGITILSISQDPKKVSFLDMNENSAKMVGYTKEELLKINPTSLEKHVTKREIEKRIGELELKGFSDFETYFSHKNGDEIIVEIKARVIMYNNQPVVMNIVRDITNRKQTELALIKAKEKAEESEASLLKHNEMFSIILENLTQGVFMVEAPGGKPILANMAAKKILGRGILPDATVNNLGEVYKAYKADSMLPYPPEEMPILQGMLGNKKYIDDLVIEQPDGSLVNLEIYGTPVADSTGRIWASLVSFSDITERIKAQHEILKAKEKAEESDRLKSAFLANMSHEIRTPMNGIIGFTELLKEPNLSTDDQQDFIQTIQISGERMLNTINNIVDVSKIEAGLMNVVIDETNINKKIEFTYKFFKPETEKKGLQFMFKNGLSTEDAIIRTDNEKVYGVLTNLIKNAIKFTYEGSIEFGYVLKSDSEPGSTERSRSERSRSASLQFYVKDTGVGIPKNLHQAIFERFRQGSNELNRLYEGSGLGLAISKSYIEMLGGKIWLDSEVGKGSTFYFTIPFHAVEKIKTEIKGIDPSEIKKVQMKNLKILIVEDDEVSYSLLKRTIQKIGKEVLHSITGVEAVETCRANPDLDLVLMDIRMPIMDGNEATRQIRKFNKNVIIIAQTAYAFAGDSEKALEAGCNDYITKPIKMPVLFELIKKHVRNI